MLLSAWSLLVTLLAMLQQPFCTYYSAHATPDALINTQYLLPPVYDFRTRFGWGLMPRAVG